MKSILAAICLACSVSGAELPADTKIEIRLKTKVSSNASKPHDPLEAIVVQPVLVGQQCVIPIGATLRGEVAKAEPSAAADQRALLQLEFTQLVGKDQKTIPFAAKVADVENGRESVDNGVIQGIVASESLSNRMDQGLSKLNDRASGLAGILQLAKTKLIKTTDSEIVYDPGVGMTIALTARETINPADVPGMAVNVQASAPDPRLEQLVNAQPFQTIAEKPPKPSDKTNLMFIGSQEQLTAAFTAAGWVTAAGLTKVSGFETFAAVAEQRGYKEAPMSVLLLENRPADFNYQKQNNTFSKRHHLRVWRRPVQWQGQDVWVASSTHDIGIDFSAENRTFIHKIDPQIDQEKMKVVWDFLGTGGVKYWTLVDRPNVPKESMNATGDKLVTDGKMAVIVLDTK